MRKGYAHIVPLLIVCCLATACSSKGNKQSQSVITKEVQSTKENDERSVWMKQYNAFLQGKIGSENQEDKKSCRLADYCNVAVPGETKGAIQYAFFDMTGDGLPELHVLTDISYSIHTMKDGRLVEWYQGDQYNRPLNNRMILQKTASETTEAYVVLDSEGKQTACFWFGENKTDYRFSTGGEEIQISKSEWKKLKKPFAKIGSDQIVWKDLTELY